MNALIIVDIQNDFVPGGALAVPEGDKIIPIVNQLSALNNWKSVLLTQDFHPQGHHSFASSHPGKSAYDVVEMSYGPQTLWPDHCVIGSKGADFADGLVVESANLIIRKGFRKEIDSYSAFLENDGVTSTGLAGALREHSVETLYLVGLATDFCVGFSALDARKAGFNTIVVQDAVRGIDVGGSLDSMWKRLTEKGVEIITSSEVPNRLG